MPKLIKEGAIVDDSWQAVEPDNPSADPRQILSLEQWLAANDNPARAVQLEPGETPEPLFPALGSIPLIAINFPVLTDGRGFSYARELREQGYSGEIRACGHFMPDQMTYLHRCGFNAFQLADESRLEAALTCLDDFSEFYQAAIDQPLPLFRRRTP
ncbi:MAG: DUF934 domain-containing protein [Cyanobacteria bacterium P01_H01_bin.152]